MKKIEVITIHRNCNYGSVLQTLATQTIFEQLGFECEVIDFVREVDTKKGALGRLKNKSNKLAKNPLLLTAAKAVMYISYVKKEKVFSAFLKNYVHLTDRAYRSNDELLADRPTADAYCTGSDQIWNSLWNEGVEPAFYLDFVRDGKPCFAYASSIGKDSIEEDEANTIRPMLEKYALLSVREGKSVGTLNALGYGQVEQVLDPTLYLDRSFWDTLASNRYQGKRYIVTYNLHHDKKLDAYADALGKAKGMPVINISYNWHDVIRKGKLAWCPSVEGYLGLIRDASYVIADSFHATAFSLQFGKQFMTFYPTEASVRMRDLLHKLDLTSRGIDGESPSLDAIDRPIDYSAVYEKLSEMRKHDSVFLERVAELIQKG